MRIRDWLGLLLSLSALVFSIVVAVHMHQVLRQTEAMYQMIDICNRSRAVK